MSESNDFDYVANAIGSAIDMFEALDSKNQTECEHSRQIGIMELKSIKEHCKSLARAYRILVNQYICCSSECGWVGPETETIHPKHDESILICPECNEICELNNP